MCFEFVPFLQTLWYDTKDFLNSTFFTAIAGSLAGAFAGAYGAQRIAERGKNREELLKEIHNTNAAIMVAFGICNSLLSLKKQHVKSLKETFDAQKLALQTHVDKQKGGEVDKNTIFKFRADFQTLSLMPLPLDILQNQVFEKLSLTGRPLSLATTLSQTVHSLNVSLEKRNQLIELYKANSPIPDLVLATLYFGLPQNGRHINQDYPACVDAIYSQTDDGIQFSLFLCNDLVEHGELILDRFQKDFGKGAPTINKPDFAKAKNSGLLPNEEDYTDWSKMFVKKQTI